MRVCEGVNLIPIMLSHWPFRSEVNLSATFAMGSSLAPYTTDIQCTSYHIWYMYTGHTPNFVAK